ncbi:hypothetical protein HDU76_000343 [Blyttiomyces sp. JEL0837]|nr:hypothetical protein HDU76_000343 [Blyttiomyces sp. JEL0837]
MGNTISTFLTFIPGTAERELYLTERRLTIEERRLTLLERSQRIETTRQQSIAKKMYLVQRWIAVWILTRNPGIAVDLVKRGVTNDRFHMLEGGGGDLNRRYAESESSVSSSELSDGGHHDRIVAGKRGTIGNGNAGLLAQDELIVGGLNGAGHNDGDGDLEIAEGAGVGINIANENVSGSRESVLPRVVLLYSWDNVKEEQTNPREIYEVIHSRGQLLPWLDVVDLDAETPPTYNEIVAALRKAALVIAFVSEEFCGDSECEKAVRFAVQGLDLPMVVVRVGPTKVGESELWETSQLGFLLFEFDMIDARDGWTDSHQHDLLRISNLLTDLKSRHPDDIMALLQSCESGDYDTVKALLEANRVDPNTPSESGILGLNVAIENGHLHLLDLLIENGADILALQPREGNAPIHSAAKQGNKDVVVSLLKLGVDILARNHSGDTAAHVAATHNSDRVLRVLLDASRGVLKDEGVVVVNGETSLAVIVNNDGSIPLHVGAQAGAYEACQILLKEPGVSADARDAAGTTPLHAAAWCGNVEVCKLLLEQGNATVNIQANDGSTPLHLCASGGLGDGTEEGNADAVRRSVAVCELLLSRPGAAADCLDDEGMTALHLACSANNVEVAKRLLAAPGTSAMDASNDGRTPLHLAAASNASDIVSLLISLVAGGNNDQAAANRAASCQDQDLWTPLHFAAASNATMTTAQLLSRFPDTDEDSNAVESLCLAKDNGGRTPLHDAAGGGFLEGCAKLVKACWKAMEVVSDEGLTPLLEAAKGGRKPVVDFLIEKGANVEAVDSAGRNWKVIWEEEGAFAWEGLQEEMNADSEE